MGTAYTGKRGPAKRDHEVLVDDDRGAIPALTSEDLPRPDG
jgi:hypothetical protein